MHHNNHNPSLIKAAKSLTLSLAVGSAFLGLTVGEPAFASTCEPGSWGCNWIFSDCVGNGGGAAETCACRYINDQYQCAVATEC